MNDQNQNPVPDPNTPPPVYHDWREQRRAERMARREARWHRYPGSHSGWFAGVILIMLGVIFLLQNLGIAFPVNWWALFILIPAFWASVAAWDIYQDSGRLTRSAAGSLTAGILLSILAMIFLSNVDFGLLWPALLIAGGLALISVAWLPE